MPINYQSCSGVNNPCSIFPIGEPAVIYEHYDKAVPLRDLCDLMGHDSRTHLKHYGAWTSDKDKKDSGRRAVGQLSAREMTLLAV